LKRPEKEPIDSRLSLCPIVTAFISIVTGVVTLLLPLFVTGGNVLKNTNGERFNFSPLLRVTNPLLNTPIQR